MKYSLLFAILLGCFQSLKAQPFLVDTSQFNSEGRPIHMRQFPNGKTVWLSIEVSPLLRIRFESHQVGVGLRPSYFIGQMGGQASLPFFDFDDKIIWAEVFVTPDSNFLRWRECDANGVITERGTTPFAVRGNSGFIASTYHLNQFFTVMWQRDSVISNDKFYLVNFDTNGVMLSKVSLPDSGSLRPNRPGYASQTYVQWLNDSTWVLTRYVNQSAGGQGAYRENAMAFDYSGNLRWQVSKIRMDVSKWVNETDVYVTGVGFPELHFYKRVADSLQLQWARRWSDFNLLPSELRNPMLEVDSSGCTLIGSRSNNFIALLRVDKFGNRTWYRSHEVWSERTSTSTHQTDYENWPYQAFRNSTGHYWLFGGQDFQRSVTNTIFNGHWYAYLNEQGCVNSQCFPLGASSPMYKQIDLKVYPNPANDVLHVELSPASKSDGLSFRLIDIYGRIQIQGILGEFNEHKVSVNQTTPGVYLLEIFDENRVLAVSRVFIRR